MSSGGLRLSRVWCRFFSCFLFFHDLSIITVCFTCMAFADSRWYEQRQACPGFGTWEIHYIRAVIYYFITDAYIPSSDTFPKERLSHQQVLIARTESSKPTMSHLPMVPETFRAHT
jgi:hypothetical protein